MLLLNSKLITTGTSSVEKNRHGSTRLISIFPMFFYPPIKFTLHFRRHDHIGGTPQESMLSVSGRKKCSHCAVELGRGAAMIIESLQLFYHIECFKCCVCCIQLGDGLMGTDVRVRNKKLHCHNCFSSDDGTSSLLNVKTTPAVERDSG